MVTPATAPATPTGLDCDVVVVERADVCGGATAWSGGWMWAPGNLLARADGVVEDVKQFRQLLSGLVDRSCGRSF